MKKLPRRLALATHTIRPLDPGALGDVRGGNTLTLRISDACSYTCVQTGCYCKV
jgi:hypothetical protein